MNIPTIAYIVFFGVFGISYFVPFKFADLIVAVAALVITAYLLFPKLNS